MLALTREKLLEYLAEIPLFMNLYQGHDPDFLAKSIDWLIRLEQTLQQLRSPLASLAATERGRILAAADGLREIEIQSDGRNLRKTMRAATVAALGRVDQAMREQIGDIDAKFAALREKMAQLMAVAVPDLSQPLDDRNAWLRQVWRDLGKKIETQNLYLYLSAALAASDRDYLLNELIDNLLSAQ